MRAIVTRPSAQAGAWVEDLRASGIEAVALPLISIAAAPDPGAVREAWSTLDRRKLVLFVSPNAAIAFFDLAPAGLVWPAAVVVASPGPGTTRVLIGLGVPASSIVEPAADAAQFDSESLWARLRLHDWTGASVLVVRGTRGRDWLAARLVEQGARVDELAAYERVAPPPDRTALRLIEDALARPDAHVWLFSSSEAIDHLEALRLVTTATATDAWAKSRAIATHPRIAARARRAGFGVVGEARPTLSSVVGCIQSIRP
ncbi:MAG: uroporphyrinogen-III synthase [Caldimonas sp.]